MSFQPNLDITIGDAQLKPILTRLPLLQKKRSMPSLGEPRRRGSRHYHHINQNVLPMVQRASRTTNQNTLPPTRISNAHVCSRRSCRFASLSAEQDEFRQGAKGLSANLEHLLYEYTQRVYAHNRGFLSCCFISSKIHTFFLFSTAPIRALISWFFVFYFCRDYIFSNT